MRTRTRTPPAGHRTPPPPHTQREREREKHPHTLARTHTHTHTSRRVVGSRPRRRSRRCRVGGVIEAVPCWVESALAKSLSRAGRVVGPRAAPVESNVGSRRLVVGVRRQVVEARDGQIRRHRASPRRCSSPRGEGRAKGGGGGWHGCAGGR
jgi:hypothetical protein